MSETTAAASSLSDMTKKVPPALARVTRTALALQAAEQAHREAILKAKSPAGPHTVEEVLAALAEAGVNISRATLYNRTRR